RCFTVTADHLPSGDNTMPFTSWLQWLKGTPCREGRVRYHRPHRRTVTRRRPFVPRLDVLEDRAVPSGLQDVLSVGAPGGAGPIGPFALVRDNPGNDNRAPDLGDFQNLQVPAGNKVAFHAYAEGVQIYCWDGTSWSFVAPEATLFADAGHHGVVGT